MTIHYVPLECLTERYTSSWYKNIPPAFEKAFPNQEIKIIAGKELVADTIEVGTFLDINSTIYFKNSQLQEIAKLFQTKQVQKGDLFFFADLEFWGIESIRLMAKMNDVKVGLFAFLHAGSYTTEDAFAVAAPYQKYTEVGWVAAFDKVFVGSHYHKRNFTERRLKPLGREDLAARIIVTGNPFFYFDYKEFEVKKKNKLLITNRFDWEKRPNVSLDMAYLLKKKMPKLEVVITTSRKTFTSNRKWLVDKALGMEKDGILQIKAGLTKDEYHYELAESKLMLTNSIEENYGYCVVEACHYGCVPLAPNDFSHPELLRNDPRMLFNNEDEIIEKAVYILENHSKFNVTPCAERYYMSMGNITNEMKVPLNGEHH